MKRFKAISSVLLLFLLCLSTSAQKRDVIRIDWVTKDVEAIERLLPESAQTDPTLENLEKLFGKKPEQVDLGFGARTFRFLKGSGYTTLSALAFRDFFKAGISFFGIGDLEAMTQDTHKFESRYLDGLIGPYPERIDLYKERSAINYVDDISAPMLILQGLEDKVVPPNQAQMMYDAVEAKGLPVGIVLYEGEQHGFRKTETIRHSQDVSLYFLGKVFGFEPADEVPIIEIANLSA